jgi:hypothetical protein
MAFLPAEAFDLGHRHAVDVQRGQGVADFVELEWFDDGDDQFHDGSLRQAFVGISL